MVDLPPSCPPQLVAEDLGTRAIPSELSEILTARFGTVHKDGAALSSEKRSGQGPFLTGAACVGVDLVPVLERVTLIRVDPDGVVHLLYSLLSIRFDLYSTSRHLFACRAIRLSRASPGGGDSPLVLCVAALCSRRAVSGLHNSPGGNIPSRLEDNSMQQGGEDGWCKIYRLGLLGVDFLAPGLRILVIGEVRGRSSQRPLRLQGFFRLLTGQESHLEEALNWL